MDWTNKKEICEAVHYTSLTDELNYLVKHWGPIIVRAVAERDFSFTYAANSGWIENDPGELQNFNVCFSYLNTLLKETKLKEDRRIDILICKECDTPFVGKYSQLCPDCTSKVKAKKRKARESASMFKAKRAAECRIERKCLTEAEVKKKKKIFHDECKKKKCELSEDELITWINEYSRVRKSSQKKSTKNQQG